MSKEEIAAVSSTNKASLPINDFLREEDDDKLKQKIFQVGELEENKLTQTRT